LIAVSANAGPGDGGFWLTAIDREEFAAALEGQAPPPPTERTAFDELLKM